MHVPADVEPEHIAQGKELVLQLIRSIAESEQKRKADTGRKR